MNTKDQNLLVAALRIMAGQGWDTDKCVAVIAEEFNLDEPTARELVLTAQRERDDIDITDTHDEIMEDNAR